MTERVYPEMASKSKGFPPQYGGPPGAYYNSKNVKQPRQAPAAPLAYYYGEGYNGRPRRRNPCCVCLTWFCAILILLIVLLGIAVLIFYLVVRPKAPKYDVQDVRLSSFSITPNGSVSSGLEDFTLNAVTTYSVEARNSNKKIGIYYDNIAVNVLSEGVSIGKGNVPAFYQGHRNTTTITGDLVSSNLPLATTAGTALQSALSSGSVPLFVTVDVRARVKVGSWKSPHFWVKVRCNVNVNPGVTSGSQILNKKCSVNR